MPEHLQAGQLRTRMLVLGGHICLPISERHLRWKLLRQVENAAARGVDYVVVRVDEPGMDCSAAGIDHALGTKLAGDLARGTDGSDPPASDGDSSTLEYLPFAIDRHDVAVCHEKVAGLNWLHHESPDHSFLLVRCSDSGSPMPTTASGPIAAGQ